MKGNKLPYDGGGNLAQVSEKGHSYLPKVALAFIMPPRLFDPSGTTSAEEKGWR
jgi:hypothetical protein